MMGLKACNHHIVLIIYIVWIFWLNLFLNISFVFVAIVKEIAVLISFSPSLLLIHIHATVFFFLILILSSCNSSELICKAQLLFDGS